MGAKVLQSSGLGLRAPLLESAKRRVQRHRHEIRRHAVRNRIERLTEIAANVGYQIHLTQLEAIANRLRDLSWCDLLVTCAVFDGVYQCNSFPDPQSRGPARHWLLGGRLAEPDH